MEEMMKRELNRWVASKKHFYQVLSRKYYYLPEYSSKAITNSYCFPQFFMSDRQILSQLVQKSLPSHRIQLDFKKLDFHLIALSFNEAIEYLEDLLALFPSKMTERNEGEDTNVRVLVSKPTIKSKYLEDNMNDIRTKDYCDVADVICESRQKVRHFSKKLRENQSEEQRRRGRKPAVDLNMIEKIKIDLQRIDNYFPSHIKLHKYLLLIEPGFKKIKPRSVLGYKKKLGISYKKCFERLEIKNTERILNERVERVEVFTNLMFNGRTPIFVDESSMSFWKQNRR